MKSLLLLLIPLLQLLSEGTVSGFNQPRPFQGFSTVRPIYIDPIKLDPNRRYARNVPTDYETFIDETVMPIVQEELHKAFVEAYNEDGNVNNEIEHDRVARSLKDNPFKRTQNRPIRFRRELEHRRYARSVPTDYETFIDDTVMPIVKEELQKAFAEAYNQDDNVDNEIEHDRVARSLKDNPFKRPPNRPIRFRRELKHHGFKDDDEIGIKFVNRPSYPTHDKLDNHNRQRRDLISGFKKPTHHDVIVPNWNPRAKTHPWQTIRVRSRRSANLAYQIKDDLTEVESQSRFARSLNRELGKPDVLIYPPTFPRLVYVPRNRTRREFSTYPDFVTPNWNLDV